MRYLGGAGRACTPRQMRMPGIPPTYGKSVAVIHAAQQNAGCVISVGQAFPNFRHDVGKVGGKPFPFPGIVTLAGTAL